MTEIRKPVRPIMVNEQCDSCGEGLMLRSDGIALMTDPPEFNYKCNKCGKSTVSSQVWPRIEYVNEGEI